MAAGKGPVGTVVEKHGYQEPFVKDVKPAVEASKAASESVPKEPLKETETDVDDNDLKALEEAGKVPYSRFKEVNEKAKQAAQEKTDLEQRYQKELQRYILENQTLKTAKATQEPLEAMLGIQDPALEKTNALAAEVQTLKAQIESLQGQSLESQIERLKQEFPDADELAALGIKKHNSKTSLREIMELLHNKVNERANAKLRDIIEAKKAKAKASPALTESGFKMDVKEKPKTVREASAIFKRLVSGG